MKKYNRALLAFLAALLLSPASIYPEKKADTAADETKQEEPAENTKNSPESEKAEPQPEQKSSENKPEPKDTSKEKADSSVSVIEQKENKENQSTEKSGKKTSQPDEEKNHAKENSGESKEEKKSSDKKKNSRKEKSSDKKSSGKESAEKTEDEKAEYDCNRFLLVEENIDREEVAWWREKYLQEHRVRYLKDVIARSKEYRLYARKLIREKQLPPELEYLPVIESAYRTSAKSRTGAVGLWQFMPNSVRNYLVLGEYVDERYDPWKSTEAGLAKLKANFDIHGDWALALAAYNCGNGKVKSAINKSTDEEKDYWTLSKNNWLPKQTAEYVPQLLAVCEICNDPKKFNLELDKFDEDYEKYMAQENDDYEFVPVKKPYMLSHLAKAMKVDENELKRLNQALTKGFTPPATTYQLRIPFGKKDDALAALKSVKPMDFPFKYKVVAGDSLWSISRKYGVTVQALCETNGIKEKAILRINQIIYIPKVK